jgi:hypothetical protein
MAKIGIITYHHVSNYGAAMQVWALQKHLITLGHEVFIIDYRPSHLTTGGCFRLPTDAWSRRANLVIGYLKVMALRNRFFGDGGKSQRFKQFHQEFLNLASPVYETNSSLRKKPPEADAYICGSDQIWNASEQFGIDSSYFLDFAPDGIQRISYAASFGRPKVHPRFKSATADLIRSLDAISVRERSGVEIVKELSDRDAEWVPDPTLLVNDGYPEAILPTDQSKDYIFSYTLRSRELVEHVEQQMALSTGLKVVSPLTLAASGNGEPGPLEWLGYIKSAKVVITNSYHGTLFSIIFKKPFVFVGLSGAKAGFNERANSLLHGLGLKERMMDSYDDKRLPEIIGTEIDWDSVHQKIEKWRVSATHFLEASIFRA